MQKTNYHEIYQIWLAIMTPLALGSLINYRSLVVCVFPWLTPFTNNKLLFKHKLYSWARVPLKAHSIVIILKVQKHLSHAMFIMLRIFFPTLPSFSQLLTTSLLPHNPIPYLLL